jgi:GGDEF domain-containing protein
MFSLRTSIGVATALTPHHNEIRTPEKVFALADKDMYEDKEKGRALRSSEQGKP